MRNSLAKFEDLQVRLAARLGNSERRNTPRVITVTSCLEREGVTTVAVGLAAVFAAKIGSRVLFVNLAPQRNGWDKKLALTRLGEVDPLNELEVYTEGQKQIQAAGHADLAGSGLLKDSGAGAGTDLRSRPSTRAIRLPARAIRPADAEFEVYRSGRYGFDVMYAGLGVDGDARQACERILGSYPAYRVVLVDAGSLRSGAAYHFKEISNQVVLVVDAARTTTPMLERQKKDMDAVDFKVDWVILNKRRFYIPRLFYPMTH